MQKQGVILKGTCSALRYGAAVGGFRSGTLLHSRAASDVLRLVNYLFLDLLLWYRVWLRT